MNTVTRIESKIDDSINFITESPPGKYEARYVHRPNYNYLTCYLSCQAGCKQACKFCHLTTTGQTFAKDATKEEIIRQARLVLEHHDNKIYHSKFGKTWQNYNVDAIHFSFMARGEPFASSEIIEHGDEILKELAQEARDRSLLPRFMISTIMPKTLKTKLEDLGGKLANIFPTMQPHIYYSIYSMDNSFRKKWLPSAMEPQEALALLKEYQISTGRIVKLHWALIKNENDSLNSIMEIAEMLDHFQLHFDINFVRYNPYSPVEGEEANDEAYQTAASFLKGKYPNSKVKIVDRVGVDVKGSCGMFVSPN